MTKRDEVDHKFSVDLHIGPFYITREEVFSTLEPFSSKLIFLASLEKWQTNLLEIP